MDHVTDGEHITLFWSKWESWHNSSNHILPRCIWWLCSKKQFISNIKWYEFLLPLVLMALSWGPHRIMTTKISNWSNWCNQGRKTSPDNFSFVWIITLFPLHILSRHAVITLLTFFFFLKMAVKEFRNQLDQFYKGNTTNKYLTNSNNCSGDPDLRPIECLKMISCNKIKS